MNKEHGTGGCECKARPSQGARFQCFVFIDNSRFSVPCSLFFEINPESIEKGRPGTPMNRSDRGHP
jgi:hypothetical protein